MVPLAKVLELDRDEEILLPDHLYRVAGIYSFGRGVFERDPIRGGDTAYRSLFRLRREQFVLSRLNGWEGAVDVVSAELEGCYVSNEYVTFTIKRELCEPSYLALIARWPRFWELLVPRGSMVRRKRVQPTQLLEVQIPLPAIDEQRRIVSTFERIVASATAVIHCSSRSAELLGAFGVSISSRPDLSDAGKEGRGWRRVTLGSAMRPASDVVPVELDGRYPNVGIYSFGRGLFEKPNILGSETAARTLNRIKAGQFIYSRLFAFEGAYWFVSPSFDGYLVSGEFPTFDPDPTQLDARWLANYLRYPARWADLASSSKGLGVRRQRVSVEALLAYRVWLPPIEEQRALISMIDRAEEVGANRARGAKQMESLVPALLNQLFAGL